MRPVVMPLFILLLTIPAILQAAEKNVPVTADVHVGGALYGDALGFAFTVNYNQPLAEWVKPFLPGISLDNRLRAGFQASGDLLPLSFYYYCFSAEAWVGYRIPLDPAPFNLTPYLSLGLPLIVAGVTEGGVLDGGFIARLGCRAAVSLGGVLETGIAAEYRAVVSFQYIGSLGLSAFAGYTF